MPALSAAYKAGLVVVPFESDPGGVVGTDYDGFVALDTTTETQWWGEFSTRTQRRASFARVNFGHRTVPAGEDSVAATRQLPGRSSPSSRPRCRRGRGLRRAVTGAALAVRRSVFDRGLPWIGTPPNVLAFARDDGSRCIVDFGPETYYVDSQPRLASGPLTDGSMPTDTAAWW